MKCTRRRLQVDSLITINISKIITRPNSIILTGEFQDFPPATVWLILQYFVREEASGSFFLCCRLIVTVSIKDWTYSKQCSGSLYHQAKLVRKPMIFYFQGWPPFDLDGEDSAWGVRHASGGPLLRPQLQGCPCCHGKVSENALVFTGK